MQIIKLSQTKDREAWLDMRRGLITGTKAKGIKPLSRGADRTPAGFWELLAEKVAVEPDGEKDIDRGQRLENEALQLFAKTNKLEIDLDVGLWVSDKNKEIAVSPDASEKSKNPTWAAEAKCLKTANHLKFLFKDKQARKLADYNPIDSIPNEGSTMFREQIVQYFVVNERLKTLYFVLYDDRIAFDKYVMHVIEVQRKEIEEEIKTQEQVQVDALLEVNKLAKEIQSGK